MKRTSVSPNSDRRWFRMTADRTRKINSSPMSREGVSDCEILFDEKSVC